MTLTTEQIEKIARLDGRKKARVYSQFGYWWLDCGWRGKAKFYSLEGLQEYVMEGNLSPNAQKYIQTLKTI